MPLPIRPHRDHSRDHLSGSCSARLVNRCNVNAPFRCVSLSLPPPHTHFLFPHNKPNDSTKIGPVLIRFWKFLSDVPFSVSKFESGLIYYELWKFLSCHTIIQHPPPNFYSQTIRQIPFSESRDRIKIESFLTKFDVAHFVVITPTDLLFHSSSALAKPPPPAHFLYQLIY